MRFISELGVGGVREISLVVLKNKLFFADFLPERSPQDIFYGVEITDKAPS
jgi:hypothetical protein